MVAQALLPALFTPNAKNTPTSQIPLLQLLNYWQLVLRNLSPGISGAGGRVADPLSPEGFEGALSPASDDDRVIDDLLKYLHDHRLVKS